MRVRTMDKAKNTKTARRRKQGPVALSPVNSRGIAAIARAAACCVENLEQRQMLTVTGLPWATQDTAIGLDQARNNYPSITGAGESVAVIDSGVDYLNSALGGGFGPGYKVEAGYNFAYNNANPFPVSNAHGTGVADEIGANAFTYGGQQYQGVAPGANLIALEENSTVQTGEALNWVIANKAKYNITAVNIVDWGGGPWNDYLSQLATLNSEGVFIAVPAGNESASVGAALAGEINVGSTNFWGQLSSFSNRGPGVQLVAPGEDMTLPYDNSSNLYQQLTVTGSAGTSWASPQEVGAAALIKQVNPNFSVAQITQILEQSGTPVYDGSSNKTYSMLNVNNAIKLAYQMSGQAAPAPVSTPAPAPTPVTTPAPAAASTAETPFDGGVPMSVTGTLYAANFDNGGQGVAYNSPYTSNPGGAYRSTGVGLEDTGDTGGGYDLSYTKAGEWIKYTITVPTSGNYNITARVASGTGGGSFHLAFDGNSAGEVSIPNTGGWQSYQTISAGSINLTAGTHVLTLYIDSVGSAGFAANFNWFKMQPASTVFATTAAAALPTSESAFTPESFPGTIYAANFDNGGQGVAYNSPFTSNPGGAYRSTGVGIQASGDAGGGYNVGYTEAGEWLNYTINVTTAGSYNLAVRVASPTGGGSFELEVDGQSLGSVAVPNTGGWQTYQTVSAGTVNLTAGQHVVRLVMVSVGSTGFVGNFNWIQATLGGTATATAAAVPASSTDAAGFTTAHVGSSTGSTTVLNAGQNYNVTAVGSNIDGGSDNFQYIYKAYTGNFDVEVEIPSLTEASYATVAGLVARASLDPGSPEASILTGPAGARFGYRATENGVSPTVGTSTNHAWLRLNREGGAIAGWVSSDGVNWTPIGWVTLPNLPATIYIGMAVASYSSTATTADFRNFGNT